MLGDDGVGDGLERLQGAPLPADDAATVAAEDLGVDAVVFLAQVDGVAGVEVEEEPHQKVLHDFHRALGRVARFFQALFRQHRLRSGFLFVYPQTVQEIVKVLFFVHAHYP